MTRPTLADARFLAALPFAVLGDLIGWLDTLLADAINGPEDAL